MTLRQLEAHFGKAQCGSCWLPTALSQMQAINDLTI